MNLKDLFVPRYLHSDPKVRMKFVTKSDDWKLPENWKEIVLKSMQEKLDKFRSFRLFMDICVRCGACADKCQFYIGSGDPKNMPVLRAELIRSVYRRYFTQTGILKARLLGGFTLTDEEAAATRALLRSLI